LRDEWAVEVVLPGNLVKPAEITLDRINRINKMSYPFKILDCWKRVIICGVLERLGGTFRAENKLACFSL